jgi:Gas vesicle synthesis protein GvpL/GvpF
MGEVDDLIREARAEARAAVKARLRGRFERELMEEAEKRLARAGAAKPTAAPGTGLWVYCVAGGELPDVPPGVAGVAAGHQPRVLRAAGLSAMVSAVPLEEFGEEALRRNLNDMDWLEEVVRAHENALEAVLGSGPIVPMRVCTIYSSAEHVEQMLAERAAVFGEVLARLGGRAEWGVKLTADRDRVAEAARVRIGHAAGAKAGAGGSYLGRKQQDMRLRDEVDEILTAAAAESHARLEEWASASELLSPQRRELSGHEGEMVLNGAYLVDDNRLDGFRSVVSELQEQYGGDGLAFDLTGPWPAFHFAGSQP